MFSPSETTDGPHMQGLRRHEFGCALAIGRSDGVDSEAKS